MRYTIYPRTKSPARGGSPDDGTGRRNRSTRYVGAFVADPDATAAKANKLGDETVREPADFPYGRDTLLRDPQGAAFHALRIPDSQ